MESLQEILDIDLFIIAHRHYPCQIDFFLY